MKNRFYTEENIKEKANLIKIEAENYCPANNITFIPQNAALLVVDMQNAFLDEKYSSFIPSASAIMPNIKNLINQFNTNNHLVIFTRHVNTESNAKMMSRWWTKIIVEENRSSRITDQLDYSNSLLIKKNQYDAFIDSDLESILKSKNISQLVVCGVMTHLCCETTARSAFMRGFEVFFCVDGTATYNEQMHRGAIINLAHGFAKPVLINEIISTLDSHNVAK